MSSLFVKKMLVQLSQNRMDVCQNLLLMVGCWGGNLPPDRHFNYPNEARVGWTAQAQMGFCFNAKIAAAI